MKKIIFALVFLFSTQAVANGHYAGIRFESRDGREGASDSSIVGFTLGKKFTDSVSAELYSRVKWEQGSDINNTRLEGAVLTNLPLQGDLSWYTRSAIGQKFETNDQFTYWSFEPGLKYKLTDAWSVKTGIRLRDSFDTDRVESSRTYRAAVEYSVTSATSLSLGIDRQKGDIEFQSIGVGLTHKF